MSKICDRGYEGGSLLSVKKINGVLCCPSCEKPAICHGKPIYQRALFWALSGDTGVSSETLARHMLGYRIEGKFESPPSDADDRGRCIRLLELVPEWIPRLPELIKPISPSSEGITINSSGINAQRNSWAEQIPLILKEGKL